MAATKIAWNKCHGKASRLEANISDLQRDMNNAVDIGSVKLTTLTENTRFPCVKAATDKR